MKPITIVTGHYGSGKTNLTVNLALGAARAGETVTVADLDIVNPYFRTADFRAMLEAEGIRVIAPVFANSNLDSPALPPEVQAIFTPEAGTVLIDVGGDDAGAVALGQFARRIEAAGYEMYYVVNERRYLTQSAGEAAQLLREIESCSRLKATALVNNTNLGEATTREIVVASLPFAEEAARLTGLPLLYSCIDRRLKTEEDGLRGVDIFVKTGWAAV